MSSSLALSRLRRAVPPGLKRWLRWPGQALQPLVLPVDRLLARAGARSRFLAGLYYAFLNHGFTYEQRAFLSGRRAYQQSLVRPVGSMAILRRNTHRLEKGLLMRPRRVPFALDYIGETVAAFLVASRATTMNPKELKWAYDVLDEYFQVCGESDAVRTYALRFRNHDFRPTGSDERFVPYFRDLNQPPSVTYQALHALAVRRRSVRWFLQQPVPRDLLDRAVELGCYAPSACNRQPFQFRIVDEPALVRRVIEIPFGTQGYRQNVPCVVVLVGQQRNYFDERDRHLIYIDGALAAMGFVLALECQGLSSCCINWPEVARNDNKMADVLKLAKDERPIMLIAVGYPDPEGMVAHSAKKSLAVVRRYNFE